MENLVSTNIIDIVEKTYNSMNDSGVKKIDSIDRVFTYNFETPPKTLPPGIVIGNSRNEKGQLMINQVNLTHSMITSTTGSGKTQGFVFSNVFNLNPSCSYIITDVKGEITPIAYNSVCEKFGKENVAIFNFSNPFATEYYFNPFAMLAEKYLKAQSLEKKERKQEEINILSKLRKLINCFFPILNNVEPDWFYAGRAYIEGCFLAQLEDCVKGILSPQKVSIENVIKFQEEVLNWGEDDTSLSDKGYFSSRPPTSLARKKVKAVLSTNSRTRSCYLSVIETLLSPYNNANIFEMMKNNTYDFISLSKNPKVIFVVYDMYNEEMLSLVNSLFTSILIELIEAFQKTGKPLKTPVILFLDEFDSLLPHPAYIKTLTKGRGMNIFLSLICQQKSQIDSLYGVDAETIRENCNLKFYLSSNNVDTALAFQKEAGYSMQLSKSKMRQGVLFEEEQPRIPLDKLLYKMKEGECFVKLINTPVFESYFSFQYKTAEYNKLPIFDLSSVKPKDHIEEQEENDIFYKFKKPTSKSLTVTNRLENLRKALSTFNNQELRLIRQLAEMQVFTRIWLLRNNNTPYEEVDNIISRLLKLNLIEPHEKLPHTCKCNFTLEEFKRFA